MRRIANFNSEEELQLDEKTKEVLGREFVVPESIKLAQQAAFDKIRMYSREKKLSEREKTRRRFFTVPKTVGGVAAAAVVFSAVCISNPALAENIPLIGQVFKELGDSLRFSGDYSKYAQPLASGENGSAPQDGEAVITMEETEKESRAAAEENSAYSRTSGGVTVTLSEIYCNEEALNLSMVFQSEEPFPETLTDQFGNQSLILTAHEDSADLSFSYNPEFEFYNGTLDGQFMDEYTYAGVLRIELAETNTDEQKIPDSFSFDLNLKEITGMLPTSNEPDMPQELADEYAQKMADAGLDPEKYADFTDEQMEQERQIASQMWKQYYELYPEAAQGYNSYNSWSIPGEWDFHVDVEVDHTENITKEINDIDENGLGVISVTKTPFELRVATEMGNGLYFAAVLDADGELMSESGSSTDILAIQDHDVSKIDIYICDYDEYMNKLKGYYWNDNIEESGYGSFRELLEARALHHTEVVF